MKNTSILLRMLFLLLIFLLASCSNTDINVQADPADTAQQAEETPSEVDIAPATASPEVEPSQQPEEAAPTIVEEPTAAPTLTPLPVFPNRSMLAYFDFLPDYDDLPDFYQLNFHRIYDAARYDDHYSLRVVYQGNNYSLQGCYLTATVTVADEGVLQPDQLSEKYTDVSQVEFPTLGESSAVLRGTRQFAWVLDGNTYIEITQVGGGTCTLTPEAVYAFAEQLYQKIPESLPSPAEFTLSFPTSECSEGNFNRYLQGLDFGNYSINDDLQRIATDLYWDTWLYYKPAYPIQEVMFGIYDTETEQYIYQRYKQSSYSEYRDGFHNWLYYDLHTAFDLAPVTGFYDFRVWLEQSCIYNRHFEIYERQDE